MTNVVLRSYVTGPRWARCDQAIKNAAHVAGVDAKVERETTLLTETVRFELRGEAQAVKELYEKLKESAQLYNDEWSK